MKKKGLAIIYDPHNLYQFIWYYCNRGQELEWDALCLPNGYKGEYMHEYCERAGLFQTIYRGNTDFSLLPISKKVGLFIGLFTGALTGGRIKRCKQILAEYVDPDAYDQFAVIADVGLVSGACVALGAEKDVVILEDGINDYGDRPRRMTREKARSFYSWQGYLLARLGYCAPGWFEFEADRYCVKYCSQPGKMKYRQYREIRQLYADEGTDGKLFNELTRRLYPALNKYDFSQINTVLLTRPLEDYVTDPKKYKRRFEEFIRSRYANVMVKKHPREQDAYSFGDGVAVTELDNSIPAEALLPYLTGKELVVVTTSATMLYMKSFGLHCTMVLFDGLYEESMSSNTSFRALSPEDAKDFAERYCSGCYDIVVL